METPSSSTRRVTRSQTLAVASINAIVNSSSNSNDIPVSRKIEDSEKNLSKSRQRNGHQQQQDRSALIDITNDSPIVGVAAGGILETPSSSMAKQRGRSRAKNTPGSGEALLRGQVKTLLQKVEEEAEISKLSPEIRPFLQLVNSPMGLLAPTPANTPQILNLSGNGSLKNSSSTSTGLASVTPSPIVEEQLIYQVLNHIFDGKNQEENPESEKSEITKSLLMDFSEKSEVAESSSEYQEVVQEGSDYYKEKPTEDDEVSIWSIQVNASSHDDEDDEEEITEKEEEEEDYYEDIEEEEEEHDDDDDGGLMLDELCAGMSNISVNMMGVAAKFAGKHTRFIYDSDDELVEEEEENWAEIDSASSSNNNIMSLRGLPTPKGKHLRFPEEEDEEEGKLAL